MGTVYFWNTARLPSRPSSLRLSLLVDQTCLMDLFDAVWTLGITSSCLMTKQCLIVFDRQTFPVWTGLKVAPYSFSAREEWELNWHKRAREERDSPSQMICANRPPRRTFPESD